MSRNLYPVYPDRIKYKNIPIKIKNIKLGITNGDKVIIRQSIVIFKFVTLKCILFKGFML